MRLICSYCRRVIRADPHARVTDVSHGMCEPCGRYFGRLWAGMGFDEYLDELGSPIALLDKDGRVITMNGKLAELIGVDRKACVGLTGGEAFACVHSRLPEGCGHSVHCRDCTVRRAVDAVARTGKAQERVPAYLDTKAGRVDLRISARPAKLGIVQLTIEEMGAPRAVAADA